MKHVLIGVAALVLAVGCGSQASRPAAETAFVTASGGEESARPEPAAPRFRGKVAVIDAATAARMNRSWRPGCPVPIGHLRLLNLRHWGFDGEVHQGELVVHREEAHAVLRVMRKLFQARVPIERMELVDEFGGDDERSMAANNTSAFNCRVVPGSGAWSEHAYGRAIDVNPLQNPEVRDGNVSPTAGAAYVDRSRRTQGLIREDGVVVRAFASIGWSWGGDWQSLKDYQHFSSGGD